MTETIELGLDTFGDVTADAAGQPLSQAQVLRNVVEQAVLADQIGLHFFGVGEHHRPDFAISAPEVVLGAIAGRTSRIHLGTSVTVLSSDDPVRVYERFSTLNALSNGRAEVIVGRGSFTESFPLFGFDLSQYNELFEERLELLAALLEQRPVTWSGRTRASLREQSVYPLIEPGRTLRVWVGVGGTPESVARAAHYGLPLILAIIGGNPRRFSPYVDLFHRALTQFGREMLPVGAHSPGHVATTDEKAREELWPHYAAMMTRIGAERGWPPVTRAQFEREAGPAGALCVGSSETVATKIAATMQALGLTRFDLKYSNGTLPHQAQMASIELYGTKVMPRVRELLDKAGYRAGALTPGA
jgi:probable LLM family oxidoreductase